ncbi:methionyl-tRNA formyltransferase [Pseudohoeflea coraliihabitans]|uniref:Methionyl-tRNA formyltransferase n=1 Tax=Pseudohoeflea coraliihabitans TaxID=2860393 RepID=A0ABS6WNP0_9HYPH|nr:methionyl-tRNA formyltransferase [Pseudohoeflea sp. DP4N28-3]MBW3097581.1 methionyl-tRNA formyltransferase [Pseudohoeflea sp. DP4N28-3]
MRLIYMGTPDYAVPTLEGLIAAGHEVAAVYSQPPRPAGRRGLQQRPSPVHAAAARHGIEVRTPTSLKSTEELKRFADLQADATIVVAYGLLLPPAILDATPLGAWNGHGSLLPRWRGAAPIQRAIMAGDTETGVMIMRMEKGLDTGPVALTERLPIDADLTAGMLHDRMAALTAKMMVDAVARLEQGTLSAEPQEVEGVTYAAKIDKSETRVDFNRPADVVHNHIRALSPFPGAWTEAEIAGRSERIKILRSEVIAAAPAATAAPGTVLADDLSIACNPGSVRFLTLQKAGGKPLDAASFLRGAALPPGTQLGARSDSGGAC